MNSAMSAPTLVLGARGYIGAEVVRALCAAGESVLAVSRNRAVVDASPSSPTLRWVAADPDAPRVLEQLIEQYSVRCVIDAVWLGAAPELMRDPLNAEAANNMLRRCRRFQAAGIQHWLGFGSCAEYAWDTDVPLAETSPLQPATPYGKAKVEVFTQMIAAADEPQMRCAWLRPFFVYGGADHSHRLLPSLLYAAQAHLPHGLREPERRLDFVRVQDVGRAAAQLLGQGYHGAVNIGSGVAAPVGVVARWVEAAVQGAAEEHRDAEGLDHQSPAGDNQVVAAVGLLQALLGWRPEGISLRSVQAAVAEYRKPRPIAGV